MLMAHSRVSLCSKKKKWWVSQDRENNIYVFIGFSFAYNKWWSCLLPIFPLGLNHIHKRFKPSTGFYICLGDGCLPLVLGFFNWSIIHIMRMFTLVFSCCLVTNEVSKTSFTVHTLQTVAPNRSEQVLWIFKLQRIMLILLQFPAENVLAPAFT